MRSRCRHPQYSGGQLTDPTGLSRDMQSAPEPRPERPAASSVTDLVGETPLVHLDGFAENLSGKYEAANPYSVKDRVALYMIEAAAESGDLPPDGTVVEATSGNTGIGLAMVSAARGYDCVLTMPESMSEERRRLLSALGADLELTPADDGMSGAIERADELAQAEGAVRARQFENAANPAPTGRRPAPRSGATPTARSTLSSPASAPAARSPGSRSTSRKNAAPTSPRSPSNPTPRNCSRTTTPTVTTSRGSAPASSPISCGPNCSTRSGRRAPSRPGRRPVGWPARRDSWSASPRARRYMRRRPTPRTTPRRPWSWSSRTPVSGTSRRSCGPERGSADELVSALVFRERARVLGVREGLAGQ